MTAAGGPPGPRKGETMKRKRKTWRDLLMKAERAHLIETNARSLDDFVLTRTWQKANAVICRECETIERKLADAGRC